MPDQHEVNEAKRAAELALYKQIEKFASSATRYDQLQWSARAFRFVSGGPQPIETSADK